MNGNSTKKFFIFSLLLMGALYAVKWERQRAAGEHIEKVAQLLDDAMHPQHNGFSGRRSRLCQMVAVLQEASEQGLDLKMIVSKAAREIGLDKDYADILTESLEQNIRTAIDLGLLDRAGRSKLAAGRMPEISKGPYVGGDVDVEYIVPLEHAPELEAYFANMILQPVFLTQELGTLVNRVSYKKAGDFYRISLISHNSYVRVGNEHEGHSRR